ncbi:MAG: hypothetical protein ABH852_02325 [Methanobacteriota archaeon]
MSSECGGKLAKEEIKRAIFKTIDGSKEDIVTFLQKLISIPSVTGDEKKIQYFISSKLEKMGLEVDIWEPDLEDLKEHPAYVPVDEWCGGVDFSPRTSP